MARSFSYPLTRRGGPSLELLRPRRECLAAALPVGSEWTFKHWTCTQAIASSLARNCGGPITQRRPWVRFRARASALPD